MLVYSSMIFFFVTVVFTINIMHGTEMAIEGLPLRRQERDASDQDILAGAEFLSVFMESSLRRAFSETTSTPLPTTILVLGEEIETSPSQQSTSSTFLRPSRNTFPFAQTTEHFSVAKISDKDSDSNINSEDGVVLAVRVSSSIGKTINKELNHKIDSTTPSPSQITSTTTGAPDQSLAASEERPSIVAAASKSELSVEEREPITKESDLVGEYSRSYPASVRQLPSQAHSSYDPTAGFLNHKEATEQPYQTVIYHDNPSEGARARSVSYSTIIQAIPQGQVEAEKPAAHERHERNYNGAGSPYVNNYDSKGRKSNNTRSELGARPWLKDLRVKQSPAITEMNWETREQPYVPPSSPTSASLPKVFGTPEQNYEVDESVSVVTNGRAHGVQPSAPSKIEKKPEDNQKFGYVVEGRNYRKYRVEERTPDGFIVGEYGVVSHDDGSLRGVRYTADGTINPRLISEALMKFLSL